MFRTRIGNGVPPYNGTIRDFSNNLLYTITNVMDDEIAVNWSQLNSAVGGIRIQITDADSKSGLLEYDNGTLMPMRRSLYGFSVSNGDPQNHKQKILEGQQSGFSYTGIITEGSSIQNDAQLIALENSGVFDAYAPLPQNPVFFMDTTFHTLMAQPDCNLMRWNIWAKRTWNQLNNGTDRTLFFNESDSMMRPDGVTPIMRRAGSEFFDTMIPSYAAPNTFTYMSRLTVALFKRYLPYINSGNVMAIGSIFSNNGEGEILFNYKIAENADEEFWGSFRTHGDFHPASVALFRQRFPMYESTSLMDIATSPRNSLLNIRWRWHNNQLIIDFEHKMADYIKANVPGLTRKKYIQIDSGSFVDELSFFRCTLNSSERAIHPAMFLFKSNDDSNVSADTADFYCDQITSLARRAGGIAILEPSPAYPYESPDNFGYLKTEIEKAKARGAGISIYSTNQALAESLKNASGFQPNSEPQSKQEFTVENGIKKLKTHWIGLSSVLAGGGFGGDQTWKNGWGSFRSANQLVAVDTRTFDNVKPNNVT